ncbi:heptaprenylglyceryl phosphate synthase [Pullulanibacillus camelliae]|uniref:Heptaprenylglyceryl phosphate synthase n=1 Tax=Pullulanibacillus camelliae TaxID=1707096 RepID=A0A8J2YGE7_9BACL|nr:heptaprenylglyceryl phosphate synthase [Pullulanibacillus camelliae]GGE35575.1 heptaprenylglyceryl phosphate synthase [Pullulanibacillus camelliae]
MNEYKAWRHVFKLDPNKKIDDDALEQLCESGTDAVIVGGTDGVTLDNTLQLLSRIRQYAVDCALEISAIDAVTPGFDYYFIPTVLNADHPDWIVGMHHEAIKEFGKTLNWDEVVMEGYCVLNPASKVASLTGADTALDSEDVTAYAMMAERMFHFPVFYLEYSGIYGELEMVQAVKKTLTCAQLFYGGGIDSVAKAEEMARAADTVIVGNVIYQDLKTALKTVKAVKKVMHKAKQ